MASPIQTSLSSTEGGSNLLSPSPTQSGSGMLPGPSVGLPTSNQGDTGFILSQAGGPESGNPTYCLNDGVEVVILGCKLGFESISNVQRFLSVSGATAWPGGTASQAPGERKEEEGQEQNGFHHVI